MVIILIDAYDTTNTKNYSHQSGGSASSETLVLQISGSIFTHVSTDANALYKFCIQYEENIAYNTLGMKMHEAGELAKDQESFR